MKIFSWMQTKLNVKERRSKTNSASPPDNIISPTCEEEYSDWPNGLFSIGTFGNSTMRHTVNSNTRNSLSSSCQDQPNDDLPDNQSIINGDLDVSTAGHVVCSSRESDIQFHSTANSNGRKSLSFLLKKALVCGGGFSSTPVLRDPFPELKVDKSRMEKILGAILRKKIYPQGCAQMATAKKFLDLPESDIESEGTRSKWVKTDSEYIVLEI